MIYFITLLGLVLRLVLANQSFWLDESASLMAAQVPLNHFFTYLQADFQPPLYYLFLKLWLPLAGQTEWLIRLPDILFGAATIPLVFLLTRKLLGNTSKVPLIAALFLALNPFHVYYSQELRMYNLSTFLVLLSWIALIEKKYVWVSLLNLLGIFTFYGVGFNFVAQGLYLFFKNRKDIGKYLLSFIPTIISFVFWWPVFKRQLAGGDFMQNALPEWSLVSGNLTIKSLLLIPIKFIIGRISIDPQKLYFVIGGTLILIFSSLCLLSLRNKKSHLFWFYFLVPLVIATFISFKTPVLGYWRYLFVVPSFISLLAIGIFELPKTARRLAISFVSLVFLTANIYFWLTPRFHREDWRGLSQTINNKNALVILPFSGVFAPLTFYQTDAEYLPVQKNLGHTATESATLIENRLSNHDSVFVLDYLADLSDPQRVTLQYVRSLNLVETKVYNFNNLGQVYEFQKQ